MKEKSYRVTLKRRGAHGRLYYRSLKAKSDKQAIKVALELFIDDGVEFIQRIDRPKMVFPELHTKIYESQEILKP